MLRALVTVLLGVLIATPALASGGACAALEGPSLGDMSILWVIPFAGLLLSIAIVPMVAGHWWHHNRNQLITALAWALPVLGYLVWLFISDGQRLGCEAGQGLVHAVIEYVSFIALLGSLFIISGGILLKGDLQGKPLVNVTFLLVGAVISNVIGTTGASMLLIQPMLRTNAERRHTWHIPVFFIFIVSNVGGALTPIGDPPLFLGYLRGVEFWWTLTHLWWIWIPTVLLLLGIFFVIDTIQYRREAHAEMRRDASNIEPLGLEGSINFLLLGGVIASVLLLSPVSHGSDDHGDGHGEAHGDAHGLYLPADLDERAASLAVPGLIGTEARASSEEDDEHEPQAAAGHGEEATAGWSLDPRDYFLREIVMALLAGASLLVTSRRIRERNKFEYGPILEVAALFVGIFVAMVPATSMLQTHGASLGLSEPWHFFWATGALSAFLDNAPTYVTFASVACGIDPTCMTANDLSPLMVGDSMAILMAISLGSVFLGAGSYIGNGPNFMVRAIAEAYTTETHKVDADGHDTVEIEKPYSMPSFFGYVGYAAIFLLPVFALVSFVALVLMA